jgi:cobalt-precorrin-5B (C1)-methyltransferase
LPNKANPEPVLTIDRHPHLKIGFTTGTAAAAAAKGALLLLLSGNRSESVDIRLLIGEQRMTIALHECRSLEPHKALCSVIKDAGDDPDITHKAEIGVILTFPAPAIPPDAIRITDSCPTLQPLNEIWISAGEGVGKVTKPGLEVPPGEPAINFGPRKMICSTVSELLADSGKSGHIHIEVFVSEGRKLARKTLNERLGIVGGISILGTTGLVKPLSHEAYEATIASALSVARATGAKEIVLTTGRRSERHSRSLWPHLPEEAFIQIGDYFQKSLEMTEGFQSVCLAVFFGKALKMADGNPHTHAARSRMNLETLARWALELTGNQSLAGQLRKANTARAAFDLIAQDHHRIVSFVGSQMIRSAQNFAPPGLPIKGIIFDFNGKVVFSSEREAIKE